MALLHILSVYLLNEILDPQVKEEGGREVQEVAELAASCIKLSGEDRPTMRQIEHKLEALLQTSNKYSKGTSSKEKVEDRSTVMNCMSTKELQAIEECSRLYSLEQDFLMSARYPR